MPKGIVVIGANFGDEGKGLMTDYFAATEKLSNDPGSVIVCRFNGGSQAGHTVELSDGTRHIFSHFGSGALEDIPTYLSKHFIVNPMTFTKEYEALEKLGYGPKVFVHPEAIVTTPYDMLANRAVEVSRGTARHGSVGLGINETVTRCLADVDGRWTTRVEDMFSGQQPRDFETQVDELIPYFFNRMMTLGIPEESIVPLMNDWNEALEAYFKHVEFFKSKVQVQSHEHLNRYEVVVFEGAQGLLLDEDHPYFPHVTRSKTGLHNVLDIAREVPFSRIDATYVTRTHMSRHGAGPFDTEIPGQQFVDLTNKPNDWQQSIRFGAFDLPLFVKTVKDDYESVEIEFMDMFTPLYIGVAVTWAQNAAIVRPMHGYSQNTITLTDGKDLLAAIEDQIPIDFGYYVDGKTRQDVHEY